MARSGLAEALKAASSSMRQGTQNQQNLLSLGIRSQRANALNTAMNQRNRLAGAKLGIAPNAEGEFADADLKFIAEGIEQQTLDEQKTRKLVLEQKEIEVAKIKQEDFDRKDFKPIEDHLAKAFGGNAFPDMLDPFKVLLDTVHRGQGTDADGNYSVGAVKKAFEALNDPKNPFPGGGELQKNIIQAGVQQGENRVKVLKADFAKMVEKNSMLGTNPEAVKADPKALEAQEGISGITEVVNQFRNFKSEIDSFTKQAQIEIEQEKKAAEEFQEAQSRINALQERERAQDIVNQARGDGSTLKRGVKSNEIAMELFGRQAQTPEEQAQVNSLLLERQLAQNFAGETGKLKIKQEFAKQKPLPASELSKLLLPGGKRLPSGSSQADAEKMGAIALSASTIDQITNNQTLTQTTKRIGKLANKIFTIEGSGLPAVIKRLANKPAVAFKTTLQSDPDFVEYQSQIEGMLALFARAFGERGVLTDLDIDRARSLFPRLLSSTGPDTRVVMQRKLKNIDAQLLALGNEILGERDVPLLERFPDSGIDLSGKDINETGSVTSSLRDRINKVKGGN